MMSQIPSRLQTEIFQRKPYLKKYFLESSDYVSYKLETARTGDSYVSLEGKSLASNYDPKKQAQRIIESSPPKDRDLIILLGLGNPCLIDILTNQSVDNQVVLAIDLDEKIIPCLWNSNLEAFAILPGKHIFAGEEFIQLLWNYMDGLSIERMSGIRIYKNPASIQLNSEFYMEIENRLKMLFSSKMSDLLTKFEFESLWISNIIRNTIHFQKRKNSYKIVKLYNILEGTPAVLVSAGPSLRSQIPLLKKMKDKMFIMSCDTSMKVLLKSGITPDAVYTLDAQMNSLFHFLGEDMSSIPLFADMVTSPYLIDTLNPLSTVFSTTAKFIHSPEGGMIREVTAGGEFADEWIGELGDIQSGGSVATTAFDALRFMGVQEIYFMGQDLAYTGREIHSTGTHHNEKWLGLINRRMSLEKINEVVVRKRDTRYVKSINGGEVLTDYVLDLYRSWFEECTRSLNDFELINIGTNGAFIEGMKNINPEDAWSRIEGYKEHNAPWKNLPPWKPNHSSEQSLEDLASRKIYDDIKNCLESLMSWRESEFYREEIGKWFQERLYLKKIYRKTEVYVGRHRDQLDEDRKKKLFIDSIEKEIKKLKRKIYPMLGSDLLGGDKTFSS
ncbi:MAG: motility associated factor glycosyltransferase family protein [Leptospira sp.]|nr:motility associated factor glycosyltransferase family protein [Leptospira sp.]